MKERTAQSTAWACALVLVAALLVIAALLGDTWVRAQSNAYTLSWWTVDGGGGALDGGGYTLTGTSGQPDAVTWSGGGYVLAGGFWGTSRLARYAIYLPLVLK